MRSSPSSGATRATAKPTGSCATSVCLALDLPSEHRVLASATIKADHPMAYADAFAAATAAAHHATLLTGGPELLVHGAPWQWEDLRATTNP